MALIPSDVGMRMRLPTDSGPQPLTPIKGIPSDLPELVTGQQFTARIQEVLPENTYRAIVAGKSLTLALPEGAKAGDTLELVVIDRSAKTIVARLANGTEANQSLGQGDQHTTLSPAAQMIGRLLSDSGQASSPVQLNRGQPLLSAPPTTGSAQLAPVLQQAITESGLFYEAHQAEWIAGKRPLGTLLQEPQGQLSKPEAFVRAVTTENANTQAGQNTDNALKDNAAPITTAKTDAKTEDTVTTQPTQTKVETQKLPDELRPLIQQQLETAASQRMVWHGEVWPGQPMEWEIEPENPRGNDTPDAEDTWNTTLRLTTPRLGQVEARLKINGNTLQLNLATPYGASAADLRDDIPALTDALAAVGINLQTVQVRHEASTDAS